MTPLKDACIVDNSVWQRLGSPVVAAALRSLTVAGIRMVTCAPQLLEYLWSARSPAEYERLHSIMAALPTVDPGTGFAHRAVRMQRALWHNGLVRPVGTADIEIAAIALENDCAILHYDRDFVQLQRIEPRLRQRAIVPFGAV